MKQVTNLILYTLVFFYINFQIINSIDPRWRRAEIIISGFKDSLRRGYGSPRYVDLTIDNLRTFSTAMKRNPDDVDIDDDFVAQHVVSDYADSFDAERYFSRDPILNIAMFENPLVFLLVASFFNGVANETIINVASTQDFRCAANADRYHQKIQLSSAVQVDLYVSYRCHGYHGLGCRFLCDVGNDVPYECLYDTNEQVCKDSRFNNPPTCDRQNKNCFNNPCSVNGKCIRVSDSISYCECNPGYMGDFCNITFCQQPCDPDFGTCIGPNTCQCAPGYEGTLCDRATCNLPINPCANQGTCAIVTNEIICECDPSVFVGKLCNLVCRPQCVFGTCLEYKGMAKCQCFEGFSGDTCNITIPEPPPVFEIGYLSVRNQRVIYFGVTGLLLLLYALVLGVGSYQRAHKKRNIRVMKGAETALRTLQSNAHANQTLMNSKMQSTMR